MRLGIWTPAPQTIVPDDEVRPAFAALTTSGGGRDASFLYAVDILRRAEALGFDITLIAQRYFGPDLDSWVFASALATQTDSIEIMAAVHPGIVDPRIAAKMGASIDRISGGRFCVNVVNGGRPHEFHMFGEWIDESPARYQRMREFITVLKGMWTEEEYTFHGDFYHVDHGVLPTKSVRKPFPPIYAASHVDEGMNVVAQECDLWFVNHERDFRKYDDNLRRIEREMALMRQLTQSHGRTISYGVNACLILGETDEEAHAKADAHIEKAKNDPLTNVGGSGVGAALIGSPATVIERMRRYQDMGIELFMLQFSPMRSGLEDFARDVLPALKAPRPAQNALQDA